MRASAKARRGSCQAMEVLLGIASLWTRTPTSTGLLPHKVDTYSPECVEQEFSEVAPYQSALDTEFEEAPRGYEFLGIG